MATTTTATREQAEQIRDSIATTFHAQPGYGPQLKDRGFAGRDWMIVWDKGPDEWACQATYQVTVPDGLYLAAISCYSVAIYPA